MRENPERIQLVRHYAKSGKTFQKILEEHSAKCCKDGLCHLETAAQDMI